ncbi:hypothetical protein V5799_023399 [Amblyomma americanum]|uniref:Evasin n=1 Tax=Amblyomma americanum TaxID=6943 RepID=A0AAQ4FHL8_AMBAM
MALEVFPTFIIVIIISILMASGTGLTAERRQQECSTAHLYTEDGKIRAGCAMKCNYGSNGYFTNSEVCTDAPDELFNRMKPGHNYTCQLGQCGHNAKCQLSGLLTGCWKL